MGCRVPKLAVALLALGGLLAGCTPGFRRDLGDRLPTMWQRIQPDDVPVLLPAGGTARAIAARRRTVGDVFDSYTLILANPTSLPGENRLAMDVEWVPDSIFGALSRPDRPYPVPLYTEERLLATLKREFPGMDVSIGDTVRRNRYGDYDFAMARDESAVCVLAWQLIDDRERILPETLAAVRLEWRVCGNGRSPEPLLRPFEGLTIIAAPDMLEAEPVDLPPLPGSRTEATPLRPSPATPVRPLPRETMREFEGTDVPRADDSRTNGPRMIPPLVLGSPP